MRTGIEPRSPGPLANILPIGQVQFNCEKTFLLQAIQFSQAVLIQIIQFSISTDLVYTQLNVKTVLY